jgi:carboxymethylenebutenolidase
MAGIVPTLGSGTAPRGATALERSGPTIHTADNRIPFRLTEPLELPTMCFDLDSSPPIDPVAGADVESRSFELGAADGNRFRAFHARPARTTGNAVLVLPDVRGLHHYYEELAVRFAEIGVEAVAIDYFGRTAGADPRGDEFDYSPHVAEVTWEGLTADITAAAGFLRASTGVAAGVGADAAARAAVEDVRALFATGFCMGGRAAFDAATLGLGLAGVIGFYGWPIGPSRNGTPAPIEAVGSFECPVLAIFGAADQGIPLSAAQEFRDALAAADPRSEVVVEPDAPHSFFDRKQAEFRVQSNDAWERTRRFIDRFGAH